MKSYILSDSSIRKCLKKKKSNSLKALEEKILNITKLILIINIQQFV